MIRKLLICNYALIERMEIAFEPGLSVITGETGAGKSIILGALSLILGQRADARVVTDASKKTVVEGWFDVSHYDLAPFFEENDIEYDAHECILRRELSPAGKSRAFINDTPVTAAQLKQLGERLIDIHSQHQNVLLSNSRFQLKLVDVLARDEAELEACRKAYVEYRLLVRQLEELQAAQARNREEEDYLRFQWSQLDEARLVEGEEADLQAEQERLSRAEELKAQLYELTSMLDDESSGILPLLNSVLSGSRAIERFFGSEQQVSERIETACIDDPEHDRQCERAFFHQHRYRGPRLHSAAHRTADPPCHRGQFMIRQRKLFILHCRFMPEPFFRFFQKVQYISLFHISFIFYLDR